MLIQENKSEKVQTLSGSDSNVPYFESDRRGFTLIELVIVMAIFSTVIVGLYRVYDVQFKNQTREYRIAESEMELGIGKNLIERDLIMAGYGIMDDYSAGAGLNPVSAVTASSGGTNAPDVLILRGTALGVSSRGAQEWSIVQTMVTSTTPSFSINADPRENLNPGDKVIITNPSGGSNSSAKTLLAAGGSWLFTYTGPNSAPTLTGVPFSSLVPGYILYGLNVSGETDASVPYYTVQYSLGGTSPLNCASGTKSLLRWESRTSSVAVSGSGDPVMSCVLDFEVAFGITDNIASSDATLAMNIPINKWDNGGVTAATYAPLELKQRLKQIRVYILVQEGSKDLNYTYVNPDPNAAAPDKIRVGELNLVGGATGRDVQLTAAQRKYRWRVLTIVVTPRNIRPI